MLALEQAHHAPSGALFLKRVAELLVLRRAPVGRRLPNTFPCGGGADREGGPAVAVIVRARGDVVNNAGEEGP